MLTRSEIRTPAALEPTGPSERVEALVGLLLVPFAVLWGVLAAIWRLSWRARPLAEEPLLKLGAAPASTFDVAAFAARAEAGECSPRRGFGAIDFELSYARDFVPSTIDAYPRFANRYFTCPPPFRRVTFASFDGTPIAAEVATRDDRDRPGLVVVHGTFGSSGHSIYSNPAVRAFAEWGFNVAVIDLRGWGRSSALSDAPMSGGWREAEDVLAAAEYLLTHSRTTTVGAMGYSLGGATVLLAAAHDRAPELLAAGVFSESGYVDARAVVGIVERNPGALSRRYIPYWLFRLGLSRKFAIQGHRRTGVKEYFERVAAPYYGVTVEELYEHDSAVNFVDRMRVPVFHLHAVDDWIVSVEHAVRLREAAEAAGNHRVGVCIMGRGAHCAFDRVMGAWRSGVARDFFAATSGVTFTQ
jgi:predicted alpha/beta-fold hydrolase